MACIVTFISLLIVSLPVCLFVCLFIHLSINPGLWERLSHLFVLVIPKTALLFCFNSSKTKTTLGKYLKEVYYSNSTQNPLHILFKYLL